MNNEIENGEKTASMAAGSRVERDKNDEMNAMHVNNSEGHQLEA